MQGTDANSRVRRGEVIAALSLATDLAMGQPVDFALKSCALATRIGRMLALGAEELAEIYYQSLLRYIGCNAETHTMAALFGDEIDFRRAFARIDMGRANEMVALVFGYLRRANADAGILGLVAGVTRGLITSRKVSAENIAGHCEVAERLAERLGLDAGVRRNLGQIYERWDGRGLPRGLKGQAIAPAVRVVSFAQDAIVAQRRLRRRRRAGQAPGAQRQRLRSAPRRRVAQARRRVDRRARGERTSGCVLALEPEPHALMSEREFDEACLAMADFADLKSPYSVRSFA